MARNKQDVVPDTNRVRVSDCTLRDARHSPGVYISVDEAVQIASVLDETGIDEIEAGILNGSHKETEYLSRVQSSGLQANTAGLLFCTSTKSATVGIAQALDIGLRSICISIPTSEQFVEAKLRRSFRAATVLMTKAVTAAVEAGLTVTFTGEDAARADIDELIPYIRKGQAAGASRFRFAESVACLSPGQMSARIGRIKDAVDLPIEVHCHSAYGLATANTVAAIDAGADWASVTIDGLGERGGNTPLGPVLLYLAKFHASTRFNTRKLKTLSELLAASVPAGVERYASITGAECFNYEIGQQFLSHDIYEDYPPEHVGNQRALVFGAKRDAKSINLIFGDEGLPEQVLQSIEKQLASTRRPVTVADVKQMLETVSTNMDA